MKQILLILGALVCLATAAAAAPVVSISPVSDSVYVLQGTDFSNVSGVDLTIRYDSAALSNPRVTQGNLVGGSLLAANLTSPGLARVALVRTAEINGSGTIATISFTRLKKSSADIQSLTASVLSGSGRTAQAGTDVANATVDSGQEAGGQGDAATASGNASSSGTSSDAAAGSAGSSPSSSAATAPPVTPAAPGVLLVPATTAIDKAEAKSPVATAEPAAEDAAKADREQSAAREQTQVARADASALKAPEPEKKKVMVYQSVLDKFREYTGKKTPQALTALFEGSAGQQPPLVLSDGKATVHVLLELDPHGRNNNFTLEGVTLVSLKSKDQNHWIAELLPDRRVWQASITIPGERQLNMMPLTVAPPMDVNIDKSGGRLTEADFKLFLKERGTDKAPRFDLNNDGKRDYIDDYIFTANYVAQQQGKKALKKNN